MSASLVLLGFLMITVRFLGVEDPEIVSVLRFLPRSPKPRFAMPIPAINNNPFFWALVSHLCNLLGAELDRPV